ncbi:helix-turn-helix domain-containing protein [Halalkalibacterium ligniniphilum]|uniref:helix-turn-helix domain-containing protein n=1 Tax=Halalkalibacterium ligniniphilum TaxID=1134413 RepID=UPI000366B8BA|nr:RstR family transcriptional repressor [Halalkalibacterium ligniniphilum]
MFSNRLKNLRNNNGYTQQEMANRLGITRQAYGKYENSQAEPDIKTLKKIAEIFNVKTDYLLGRTDKPTVDLKPESEKENLFFFDQENITPEEAKELKKHLEFLRYKARQENEKDTKKKD